MKTIEKNWVTSGYTDELKSNITDYLHNYITQINSTFSELEVEFELEMKDDVFCIELITYFTELINELIYKQIYPIIDNILTQSKNNKLSNSTDIITNIKLFYYYTSILIRSTEYFDECLIKEQSISLVTVEIKNNIERKLDEIFSLFYNIYVFRIVKEIKIIYINKEFIYLKTFLEKFSIILNEFFGNITDELMKYKLFENKLIKFIIYVYLYVVLVLVLSIPPIEEKGDVVFVDFFINIFNQVFKLKDVKMFIDLHESIK